MYSERNEEKRKAFIKKIDGIPLNLLVYLDESGIEHNIIQESGWSPVGTKIIGNRSGTRERTSVMAGLCGEKILAPIRYSGTADSVLFLYWVKKHLLPELKEKQIIILDNCPIHKSPKVRELIESTGCKLLYLPRIHLIITQ